MLVGASAANSQSAFSFIFNLFVFLSLTHSQPFFLSYFGPFVYTIISGHTEYHTAHTHEYVDSYNRNSLSISLFHPRSHFVSSIGCIHGNCVVSSHHNTRKQYPHSTILSSNHLISDYHKLCVHEYGRLKSNLNGMVRVRVCVLWAGC